MPRYYFDIDDIEKRPDDEGEELEGLNAARIHAVTLSGELLKNFPDRFWSVGQWNVSCRDETGLILFVLHFFAQEAPAMGIPRGQAHERP
ncbi:hypothetical protein [Brevundimonas sp.]|uniref:DUF6894 family protein n=1 Tax=Brevundimonas sp. TaxID=1871086 RepID=UPI001DA4F337|nr:hypothetical protein [Brevundimonas sp.]MBA4000152.1 hypothetical protein [Brevundimonas sp.]